MTISNSASAAIIGLAVVAAAVVMYVCLNYNPLPTGPTPYIMKQAQQASAARQKMWEQFKSGAMGRERPAWIGKAVTH